MSSVNKVFILGRLGNDPETVKFDDGSMCKFSVATEEVYKKNKTTQWHNVVAYGTTGENCSKFLRKGSMVWIDGKVVTRQAEKNGVKTYYTSIVANNVKFINSNKNNGGNEGNESKEENYSVDYSNASHDEVAKEEDELYIPF